MTHEHGLDSWKRDWLRVRCLQQEMGSDEETFDAGSTNMTTRENGWDVS